MKMLMITNVFPPYVFGGVSYIVYQLAKAFSNMGHDIHVVSAKTPSHKYDSTYPCSFPVHFINCKPYYYHIWYNKLLKQFLKDYRTSDFDVALTNCIVGFDLEMLSIMYVHDCIPVDEEFRVSPSGLVNKVKFALDRAAGRHLKRHVERKSFSAVNGLVYNSWLTKRYTEHHYPSVRCKENNVIYYGVDAEFFQPTTDERDDYFLFVGGLAPRKGIHNIVDLAMNSDYKIKVVGSGGLVSEIRETKSTNIEYLGYVEQKKMPDLYSRAIATIHPTLYEPFGCTIMESLACGTPVIVSNEEFCGASEIMPDACVKKINPLNHAEFLTCVNEMYENRNDIRRENHRNFAVKHSWSSTANEIVSFIKEFKDTNASQ